MPKLYLAQSHECWYSREDADLVGAHRWMLHRTTRNGRFYAYTFVHALDPLTGLLKRRKFYMHRMITAAPAGFLVDHADRDGLNNRRWNMRITTGTYNNANAESVSLSGYRGVIKQNSRWRARIHIFGDDIHLGMFDTAREAAVAYDVKALELFGEFAWLNFNDHAKKLREDEEREAEEQRELQEVPF